MSDVSKSNIAWAVEVEDTEGTYKAPASAASFVQVLKDGSELSFSKELLERNIYTGSLRKVTPRTGQFQVSGSVATEFRAHSTEGTAPEYDALMKSALGARRQISTTTTTKASGNTGSVLQIENADITKFAVNDIICVKQSGGYHISPIAAVDDTADSCNIELLIPKASGSFSDSVVISKATIYTTADADHPSLSISKYYEGAILDKAVGCKIASLSLDSFSTGQIASWKFGFEGLNFDRTETVIPYSPSYDTAKPPIILSAKVYQDGNEIAINDFSFSLENTLGFKTSTGADNGRIASKVTDRSVTGSINPFMADDDISNFTKYKDNVLFDLFAVAKIPGASGAASQIVAVYLPNCLATEMAEADQDGLLQESINFSAGGGDDGQTPEVYVAFI